MYLCICKSVSDRQIREAVELGARTIGDLSVRLGVGIECGKCIDSIGEFLESCLAAPSSATLHAPQPTAATVPAVPSSPVTAKPAPAPAWFAVDL